MLKPRPQEGQQQLKPSASIQGLETCGDTRQSVIDFLDTLKGRGISLVLRRNRVNAGAQHKLLTADERAFINQHRAALKELLQEPQRGQRESRVAPVAEVAQEPAQEPEPVLWDYYYHRITAERVQEAQAAGAPTGRTKSESYELAQAWLEQERLTSEEETHVLMRHHAAKGREQQAQQTRGGVWEGLAYE